jgi:hypothetical protein
VFDTHDALHETLAASGIWNGLYTALLASKPPLAVRAHETNGEPQVTGLQFFEQQPYHRQTPIRGAITVNPDDGTIAIYAEGYTGPRWFTALERLGTVTAPAPTSLPASAAPGWAWQPADREKPGALTGTLQLGAHIVAETLVDHAGTPRINTNAAIALTPADRDACENTWALAVTVLGTLVTEDPDYQSTVLPAPDPTTLTGRTTDYPAAICTVCDSLAAIDDNANSDSARDPDHD